MALKKLKNKQKLKEYARVKYLKDKQKRLQKKSDEKADEKADENSGGNQEKNKKEDIQITINIKT